MRDDKKQNVVTVELTKDQVKAAPEFKEGSAVVILGAWATRSRTGRRQPRILRRRSEAARRPTPAGRSQIRR